MARRSEMSGIEYLKADAINAIYTAIEASIRANFDVKDFLLEAREAWEEVLREQGKHADLQFKKLLTDN